MRGITEEELIEFRDSKYTHEDQRKNVNFLLNTRCKELNPWRPIKSAPQDRNILMFHKDQEYGDGFQDIGMFSESMLDNNLNYNPTHWQELPEDPK